MSAASSGGVRSRAIFALHHGVHRLGKGFSHFVGFDLQNLRHAGDEVAPFHLHGLDLVAGIGGSDVDLDELGGALADQQIVLALYVLNDGLVPGGGTMEGT